MLNINLPKCKSLTSQLKLAVSDFQDVKESISKYEPAKGVVGKFELDILLNRYDCLRNKEILSRMRLSKELELDELAPKRFENGFMVVKRDGGTELRNEKNELVFRYATNNIKFAEIGEFHQGIATIAVSRDGEDWRHYFIEENGRLPAQNTQVLYALYGYSEGFYLGNEPNNSNYLFFDEAGNRMEGGCFDRLGYAMPFGNGIAFVQNYPATWHFINTKGEPVLVAPNIVNATTFSENRLNIQFADYTGSYFLDENYRTVLGPYGDCTDFHEGKAWITKRVNDRGPWGLIDRDGKRLLPYQFHSVSDFHEGFARVTLETDGDEFFINEKGEAMFPQFRSHYGENEELTDFKDGVAKHIDMDGNITFFDTKGNILAKKEVTK
jgi:hypothetical protein